MRKTLLGIPLSAGILLSFAGLITAAGLTSGHPAKTGADKSLYERLGGKPAIVAVVNQFVDNVAHDDRINKFFATTAADPKRLQKFKNNLVDQVCQASGGPCKYKGKDMKTAHQGMGITDADFNALVEDLVAALNKFNVGDTEKNELLGVLGPMRPQIVE